MAAIVGIIAVAFWVTISIHLMPSMLQVFIFPPAVAFIIKGDILIRYFIQIQGKIDLTIKRTFVIWMIIVSVKKNECLSDQTNCHKREFLLKFDLIRQEV